MKRIKKPEINLGLWIDQEKAYIIRIGEANGPRIEKIKSGVESRVRFAGEGKISARFGNTFVNNQEKKQRRQKNQRHHYFQDILTRIQDAGYIFLFGPSDARHELVNEIEKVSSFKGNIVCNESADRMTEKQMMKETLDFFESESFRSYKRNKKKEKRLH
jgi:hypothetical protein